MSEHNAPEPTMHRTLGGNLGVSRRGFMRATAAGTGAVAVGAASTATPFSPVEESEAVAPILAAGAVGIAAGGYAGVRIMAEWQDNTSDADFSDQDDAQFKLEAWDKFNALQLQGEPGWVELVNAYRIPANNPDNEIGFRSYQSAGDTDSAKLANNVWSEIRKTTAKGLNNGDVTGDIVSDAADAADHRMMRALVNIVTQSNAEIDAISSSLAETVNRGLDFMGEVTVNGNLGSDRPGSVDPSAYDNLSGVVYADDAETQAVVVEIDMDWRVDPSTIEGFDQDSLKPRAIVIETDSGEVELLTCLGNGTLSNGHMFEPLTSANLSTSTQSFGIANGEVEDLGHAIPVMTYLYRRATGYAGVNLRGNLQTEIQTYVESVADQIEAGEMAAEDILGPDDIVSSGDDGGAISRVTAELAASGFNVPQDVGNDVQFTVGHPDLPGSDNEMTGWMYIDLDASAETPLNLSAGDTLASGDYSAAYLVYNNADGETDYSLLSGDSDLSVVEIHGQDDDGNDIESLDFNNYTPSVADPNDPEDIQATTEAVNDLRDEIEELREEEASGGGGGFLPDLGGGNSLGLIAIVVAGGALLLGRSGD